ELLVAWFVRGRDDLVALCEASVGPQFGVMETKRIGLGVRVVVLRGDAFARALLAHDRDAALGADHILHEIGRLADHGTPGGLVPTDRSVGEGNMEMTVVVHRRRYLLGQPRADGVDKNWL